MQQRIESTAKTPGCKLRTKARNYQARSINTSRNRFTNTLQTQQLS